MSRRQPQQKHIETESEEEEEETDEEEEEVDPCEKIQALPLAQRRRIYGLKALVKATKAAQKKKRDRIAEIEKDFLDKMQPLFELRRRIVAGEHEPTAAEVARGANVDESKVEEIPSDDEADKKPAAADKKKALVVAPSDEDESAVLEAAASKPDGGIPNFWITVLKNNEVTEGMVMERDEPALRALTNVTTEFIDGNPQKGFKLSFFFAENPFFTNKVLTKTYIMDPEDEDEYALDDLKGTEINWTSVSNKLTVIIKQKKQRHKSGKGVRVVEREEKAPSFFHFFDPPAMPADEEEDDEEDEEEDNAAEEIQMDFEAGQAFHEMIIPRAVHYYTGESIAEMAAGMMGMGMDGDDDEEDEEDDEEESEDEAPAKGGRGRGGAGRGGRGRGNGEDCKQQ